MAKTILVTGGAGFIGSHVVDRLMARGGTVVVVDNFNRFYSPRWKRNNLTPQSGRKNYHLVTADVRDSSAMKQVFSAFHFDCVVHLAAMAGVRPSIEKPRLYTDVNVLGTLNILQQMKHFTVPQLIFASSSSVYGNRSRGPFKETDRTDEQVSPYGATKKAGELLCHTYAHLYGIKTTVLRLFTVYGPRNRPDMACYTFLERLARGKPIMRFGSEDVGRDFTYVEDIADGITAAIDRSFAFEIINLGNSKPIRLSKIISKLEQITGRKAKVLHLPSSPGDVQHTHADITKARRLLRYLPKVDIDYGLQVLYAWYQETSRR